MAVTHSTPLRNDLADAVDNFINTGGGTALWRLRDSTVTIVDFPLANPAYGAASGGTITLASTPIGPTAATGTGDVDNAQNISRGAALGVSCSVTVTGMGGDIEMDNTNVVTGQDCTLVSLTYSAPP